MPFSEKARATLAALKEPRDNFRETVMLSIEEIQGFLATHRDPGEDRTERVTRELGNFAAGRIDAERFASVLQEEQALDREVRHELDLALDTLTRLHERGDDLFMAQVAPGGDLRDTVARALSEVGRAFAAARLVSAVQKGRDPEDHDASQKGFPFRRWSRDERSVSPPLVVQLSGEDLLADGLAEFLDGSLKLALVIEGKAPPAALAGLIRPGVWVEQVDEPSAAADFAASDAAGALGVMSEGAAFFRYDPSAGRTLAECLTVESLPEGDPRARIGAVSVAQQTRDLDLLRSLAEAASAAPVKPGGDGPAASEASAPAGGEGAPATSSDQPPAPPAAGQPAAPGSDPVGALAGWLLQNSDLSGA